MRAVSLFVVFASLCIVSSWGIIFHVPPASEVCFGEELGYDMVVHGKTGRRYGYCFSSNMVSGIFKKLSGSGQLSMTVQEPSKEDDGNFVSFDVDVVNGIHSHCYFN